MTTLWEQIHRQAAIDHVDLHETNYRVDVSRGLLAPLESTIRIASRGWPVNQRSTGHPTMELFVAEERLKFWPLGFGSPEVSDVKKIAKGECNLRRTRATGGRNGAQRKPSKPARV